MNPRAATRAPARKTGKARHGGRARLVADAKKRIERKRKQTWTVCIVSALALCTLTTLGILLFADRVISTRPAWWSPPDAGQARTVAIAERFERRVSDELTALRDEEERWTITLTDDEVASWIASRLPVWLEAEGVRWPLTGRPFDLDFQEGRVLVGMPMTGKWQRRAERVVVAELGLGVTGEGGLVVRLDGITLGQLPLPDAWAKGHLEAAASRAALDPWTVDAVMTGEAALREASLPIDGHRVVRVEAIALDEGALTLTCRTLPRAHAQR